jgi:hypothetical protein
MLSKQMNRFAVGVALVVLASLATPALGLAAGSPTSPLAVNNEIRHLDVGGQDWYAFTTAGADGNNDPSHVLIILRAVPNGSATFRVWTAEGLKEKATEDPGHPVYAMGEGTRLEYKDGSQTLDRYGGDLVWHNGFEVGGTFYVQVGQAGSQASDYKLTISGDNISFPASASTGAAGSSATQSASVAAAATNRAIPAEDVPGSGMNTAMVPTGQIKTVNPGEQQWYAVTLGRPVKDEDEQNLNVELVASAGGAKFTVWTAARLNDRAASANPDRDAPPIGQGTKMIYKDGSQTLERAGGNLTWSGDASYGGTFYIIVESTSSAPIQYSLNTGVALR